MKKKRQFAQMACTGLTSGFLIAAQASDNPASTQKTPTSVSQQTPPEKELDKEEGNMGYHLMSEQELLLQLDSDGQEMYQKLDSEGKALARLVASSRCDHTNECKHLNACKTPNNDCAGKGPCRGMGKCALADKNLAVKLVADKMAEKRQRALNH